MKNHIAILLNWKKLNIGKGVGENEKDFYKLIAYIYLNIFEKSHSCTDNLQKPYIGICKYISMYTILKIYFR